MGQTLVYGNVDDDDDDDDSASSLGFMGAYMVPIFRRTQSRAIPLVISSPSRLAPILLGHSSAT